MGLAGFALGVERVEGEIEIVLAVDAADGANVAVVALKAGGVATQRDHHVARGAARPPQEIGIVGADHRRAAERRPINVERGGLAVVRRKEDRLRALFRRQVAING